MNIKRLFVLPIILYQKLISPFLPGSCRFNPTCSEYSKQAILKYGVAHGVFLSFKRIVKCHPWGGHGNDPLK
jgi:putative membrane protein insertion efficiency factor|tara:strand:- start:2118 stop:2333 length:216 start_codon:yes stop_codon:yes gene_type:complete